jgi:tetratricopeptide (TPR) repeat protein
MADSEQQTLTGQQALDLGVALHNAGRFSEAESIYQKILQVDPNKAEAHNNLGLTLQNLGRLDEAMAGYRNAVAIKPDLAEAHYNLANALKDFGKLEEAIASYSLAVAINPKYVWAHNNRGIALMERGSPDEAMVSYRKALAIEPDYAPANYNLGNALMDLGKLDSAIACYRKALASKPDYVEVYSNLGAASWAQNKLDEAVAYYRKAIAIAPEFVDAQKNLSYVLLLQGNLKEGWEKYDWRLKAKDSGMVIPPIEMWSGSSLQEKSILVFAEQGVGDEIAFASCIGDLLERSPRKLYLECDPRLEALFVRSFPGVHIRGKPKDIDLSWIGENAPPDYALPIGSLPKFFRNSIAEFPERDAYLAPHPALVKKWKQRFSLLKEGPKIGISWRGGMSSRGDRKVSPSLSNWRALLSMSASFINLQYGDVSGEMAAVCNGDTIQIHDWEDNDPLADLDNQAALISCLDLVITVSNTTVHMAGALGIPTWALLEKVPYWQWSEAFGDYSPLYRSVRLFRQQRRLEWGDVLDRVAQGLGDFIRNG